MLVLHWTSSRASAVCTSGTTSTFDVGAGLTAVVSFLLPRSGCWKLVGYHDCGLLPRATGSGRLAVLASSTTRCSPPAVMIDSMISSTWKASSPDARCGRPVSIAGPCRPVRNRVRPPRNRPSRAALSSRAWLRWQQRRCRRTCSGREPGCCPPFRRPRRTGRRSPTPSKLTVTVEMTPFACSSSAVTCVSTSTGISAPRRSARSRSCVRVPSG